MPTQAELGSHGEEVAVALLKRRKYKILERNYQCAVGEIDIIALDGKTLVFVEVKTRSTWAFGSPQAAVTPKKQRQLAKVAAYYLQERRMGNRQARFDVVAVTAGTRAHEVEVIRNAFEVER